jgi:hypothetical protein
VLGTVGYLFIVQNSQRVTDLSLDLGFLGAVHLQQPMAVTHLLGIALGSGFLGGLILGALSNRRKKESSDTFGAAGGADHDWT